MEDKLAEEIKECRKMVEDVFKKQLAMSESNDATSAFMLVSGYLYGFKEGQALGNTKEAKEKLALYTEQFERLGKIVREKLDRAKNI